MKCMKCGTENQVGISTCAFCGNPLDGVNSEVNIVPSAENNVNSNVNVVQPVQSVSIMNNNAQSVSSVGVPSVNANTTVSNTSVMQPVQSVPIVNSNVQPISNNNTQISMGSDVAVGMSQSTVTNNESIQVNSIGSVQPVASQGGRNIESKNKKLKVVLIILIVVLVVAIGLAVWVYFAGQEKLKKREEMLENRIEITWTPNNNSSQFIVGTEVTLVDDSKWYVIGQEGDVVTLISSNYYGDKTHFSNSVNDYEKSVVKDIIDNQFLPELTNSLTTNGGDVTGLKARIISVDEIREVAGVLSTVENGQIELDSNFKWLYSPGSYWTSTQGVDDYKPDYTYVYFVTDFVSTGYVEADKASYGLVKGNEFYIRPVIEIDKSNIKM